MRKFKARDEREIVLRYPKMGDVDELLKFVNEIIAEPKIKVGLTEKLTKKEERLYLKKTLKDMENKKAMMIEAESKKEILGQAYLGRQKGVNSHIANFGIFISKYCRNSGIGTKLTEAMFREAKKMGIKIIILQVFSNNITAIKLYKNFGFKTFGRLPKGIRKNGKYVDEIYMYKNI